MCFFLSDLRREKHCLESQPYIESADVSLVFCVFLYSTGAYTQAKGVYILVSQRRLLPEHVF